MSNYTQITFFTPKDSLASGNPAKLIKGALFDPEFAAIATAIASKYDSSSIASNPVLFGAGTAALPSIAFTGGTNNNTGLYLFGANSLGFAAGGLTAGNISSAQAWTLGPATAAVTLTLDGAANQYAEKVVGNSTSGESFGTLINAGTTSADNAFAVQNQAASVTFLQLKGDGSGLLGANSTNCLSWTNAGVFTLAAPSSANSALSVNAANNAYGIAIVGGATASQSFGLNVKAGTNINDVCALFQSKGGVNLLAINGGGSPLLQGFGATANGLVDMTPDTGSFTGTLTGMSSSVTGTCVWNRMGNLLFLTIPAMTGTSNANAMTLTGGNFPNPARTVGGIIQLENSSAAQTCSYTLSAAATITFYVGLSSTGFTNTGTKGVPFATTICIQLD